MRPLYFHPLLQLHLQLILQFNQLGQQPHAVGIDVTLLGLLFLPESPFLGAGVESVWGAAFQRAFLGLTCTRVGQAWAFLH